MKIKQKFSYFEITGKLEFPSVEMKFADDFARFAEAMKVTSIFKTTDQNNREESWFLLLADATFFKLKSQGYTDLNDLAEALEMGFPNAEEFYEARKGNFMNYGEYIECKKAGITDRGLLLNAQKGGFIENFDHFKEILSDAKIIPDGVVKNQFNSAIEVYKYANQKGFKEYNEFQKAFFAGFPDKALFEIAAKVGFSYAEDYIKATKAGFPTASQYNEAVTLDIKTGHEFIRYVNLHKEAADKYGFDELELIREIKKIENGRKLSLKRLNELLQEVLEKNKTATDEHGHKKIPGWFICKIKNPDDIARLLCESEEAKKIGHYDKEGEFYEVSRISDKIIYLDGSNVAYSSMDREAGFKPMYRNILLMAEKLKSLRFTEIFVIADSSLRHIVTDSPLLDKVKNTVKYLESPSHTSADEFLLQKVKTENCFLVSNDTFKEWRLKDPWIAMNIDRIRVPFMLINDEVSLPILELSSLNNQTPV